MQTHEAAQGYAEAVKLLPIVAWHGLNRTTREEQLAQWDSLAVDAAACTVLDGRPEIACELLEQGRSILWSQALNLRTDLGRLMKEAPQLANRLEKVRAVLDSPIPDATGAASRTSHASTPDTEYPRHQQDAVEVRRRMAREWDEILAEAQALDGFKHFLATAPYAELAAAAAGPIVMVNVSSYQCHALIANTGTQKPAAVELPELSRDVCCAGEYDAGHLRRCCAA